VSSYIVRSGRITVEGPLPYAARVAALNAFDTREVTVTYAGVTVAVSGSSPAQLTVTNVTQHDLFATQPTTNPPWVKRLRTHLKNQRKAQQ